MIPISDFVRLLKIENELIHQQTDGLTQAETLIQPQPSGNCMNWVLGHLLDTQLEMLSVLGGNPPAGLDAIRRYTRGSEPVARPGPDVFELTDLLAGLDAAHQAILLRLESMTEADFEQDVQVGERIRKRGWQVFFLHFHYTYHVGQLEQLRQLAGHGEQII